MGDDDLLRGLDGPRPLPGELRERLEDALVTDPGADLVARLTEASAPRPLPDALRESLRVQLAGPPWWRRGGVAAGAAAAAAAVAVAALLLGPTSRPPATSTALPGVVSPGVGAGAGGVTGGTATSGRVPVPSPTTTLQRRAPSRAASDGAAGDPVLGTSGGTADGTSGGTSGGGAAPGAGEPAAASPRPAAAPRGPRVDGLAPSSGPVTGGNVVTVSGAGFGTAPEVFFGSVRATAVEVVSGSVLRVVAPANLPGEVAVTVRTPQGTSAVSTGCVYRYG